MATVREMRLAEVAVTRPRQQAEIVESVTSGRKSAAEMARLYRVSEATVSRIMAEHRQAS